VLALPSFLELFIHILVKGTPRMRVLVLRILPSLLVFTTPDQFLSLGLGRTLHNHLHPTDTSASSEGSENDDNPSKEIGLLEYLYDSLGEGMMISIPLNSPGSPDDNEPQEKDKEKEKEKEKEKDEEKVCIAPNPDSPDKPNIALRKTKRIKIALTL